MVLIPWGEAEPEDATRPLADPIDCRVDIIYDHVTDINTASKSLSLSDSVSIPYDYLVVATGAIPDIEGTPEFKPSPLIAESGLGETWMEVDKHTFESDHADDVFGVGDVTNIPTSKAGSVAHYTAGTIVDRVAALARANTPQTIFNGDSICFIQAGTDTGSHMSFQYDTEPVIRDETEFIHCAKLTYNESYWLTARGLA